MQKGIAKTLYNSMTGLVRCAGKFIAKIIQMYNENSVDRSADMKRRSTRHVSEITAIASEFGNSAKIIVPRSWFGSRVIAFLYSD
jgi:putative transposon-encoded protein